MDALALSLHTRPEREIYFKRQVIYFDYLIHFSDIRITYGTDSPINVLRPLTIRWVLTFSGGLPNSFNFAGRIR